MLQTTFVLFCFLKFEEKKRKRDWCCCVRGRDREGNFFYVFLFLAFVVHVLLMSKLMFGPCNSGMFQFSTHNYLLQYLLHGFWK